MAQSLTPVEHTLLDLLNIDSPTGGEEALHGACVAWFRKAGWRVRSHGLSLIADNPEHQGPKIGLLGHLDVVTDRVMAPISVDDTTIFGPGTSDMKGGLAVMLELARQLKPQPGKAAPVFIFYDAEEGPVANNGLAPLLDAHPDLKDLELGVCLEPTANQLQMGCVGSLHVDVCVRGKAGHSARPWEGVNAVTKAAGLLARLDARQPVAHECDGLTFFDTTTVTLAQGGHSRNSVPAELHLNVNLRFVPGRTAQNVYDEFVAWVGDDAVVTWKDSSSSAPVATMTPRLQALVATGALKREAKQAWTDVAQLAERGIPGINFGPGDPAWAHQAKERIVRADLNRNYAIFEQWLGAH
jgi:succinyl-diaminopimelate desuccinylase